MTRFGPSTGMFMRGGFGLVALLALGIGAAAAQAQPAPPPQQEGQPASVLADQPAAIADVRARWEGLTEEQIKAQGFVVAAPACVSSPFGGMGYHAMHFAKYQQQWAGGVMDVNDPPILLLDATRRVVGLEWEADGAKPAPTFLGAKVLLQPGHPGAEDPHYMIHVYFKPHNQVLWAIFDPDLICPQTVGPPTGMPATGTPPGLTVVLALLAGGMLLTGGLLARRAIRAQP